MATVYESSARDLVGVVLHHTVIAIHYTRMEELTCAGVGTPVKAAT